MNIDQKIEALLNSTSLNSSSGSGSTSGVVSQKGKIKIWGITATASLLLSCILVYVIKPVYVLNLDYSTVEKKVHQNINWKRWFTAVFAISLLIAYPVYSFVLLKF
jgi:hypothetical protein